MNRMNERHRDNSRLSVAQRWQSEPRVSESEYFFAILDAFPVNPGHTLVVSKRPCRTIMELTPEEFADLHTILLEVRRVIDDEFEPDGYNIGANAGGAAGQTVDWCHIHVIPRYLGDVRNPEGGVRGVIPGRASYRD